ncbi:MAG: repeat domain protein [Labilithrix sp.]|nr:repeat domain protein [Labilithrix sp.]
MKNSRNLLVISGALSLVLGLASACSEDESRGGFEPASDGDAGDANAPSLPEAEAPVDASKPIEPFDGSAEPVVCAVTPCAVELVAGSGHFCARLSEGTVRCWGADTNGALGAGPAPEPAEGDDGGTARGPVVVSGLADVVQLSAAGTSTCARLSSGTTRCWGGNAQGQLGIRTEEPFSDGDAHDVPADVATAALARIDLGLASACGVTSAGTVQCWGDNSKGQLTLPDFGGIAGPTTPAAFAGLQVARTAASRVTGYALLDDGRLVTWGTVAARPSSFDVDPMPAPVPAPSDVNDLAVGPQHACATSNGEVFCWGAQNAPTCTGLPDAVLVPRRAPLFGEVHAQQISVSNNNTCVRLTNASVQCCGSDAFGQLGDGDAGAGASAFRPVRNLAEPVVHVATADNATCVLHRNGAVSCWGRNAQGELGGLTRDQLAHPVPTKVVFQ